jgi:hypothetical protein
MRTYTDFFVFFFWSRNRHEESEKIGAAREADGELDSQKTWKYDDKCLSKDLVHDSL